MIPESLLALLSLVRLRLLLAYAAVREALAPRSPPDGAPLPIETLAHPPRKASADLDAEEAELFAQLKAAKERQGPVCHLRSGTAMSCGKSPTKAIQDGDTSTVDPWRFKRAWRPCPGCIAAEARGSSAGRPS